MLLNDHKANSFPFGAFLILFINKMTIVLFINKKNTGTSYATRAK